MQPYRPILHHTSILASLATVNMPLPYCAKCCGTYMYHTSTSQSSSSSTFNVTVGVVHLNALPTTIMPSPLVILSKGLMLRNQHQNIHTRSTYQTVSPEGPCATAGRQACASNRQICAAKNASLNCHNMCMHTLMGIYTWSRMWARLGSGHACCIKGAKWTTSNVASSPPNMD